MTTMIPPLKVGQRVAVQNCTHYGTIAKRIGQNRYWVTMDDSTHGPVTIRMNRNTFKPVAQ